MHGVHDLGLLTSALERPRAGFADYEAYTTLEEKAAALFHSLIKNHPFRDGNKRTAVAALEAFLHLNGLVLQTKKREFIELALAVASDRAQLKDITLWVQQHT